MKYSFTIRLLNLLLFAALGVGFGFLGVYFGLIVSPNLWTGALPGGLKVPDMSLALALMLGALGLAGLTVCVFGLVKSVLAIVRRNDDEMVRSAFGCYISIGYVVAVFFLMNAVWLYRLLTTNLGFDDIGFAIIIYVILLIVALIASSIPLVKMFGEGEGTNRVMRVISRSALAIDLGIFLPLLLAFFVMIANQDSISHASILITKFGTYWIAPFIACALAGVALFGYARADKAGTYNKLNGILFESAICVNGLGIILMGILNYVYWDGPYALMAKSVASQLSENTAIEFTVVSSIVGGVMILLAALLVYLTLFPKKKEQGRA